MKKLNVLSLFDGMSCGRQALEKLNVPVRYFASEVDKYAVGVTSYRYPDTIQLGDVRNIHYIDGFLTNGEVEYPVGNIDLLIGGSPCTDFSFAGKGAGMSTSEKIEVTNLEQYLELKSAGFQFKGESYLFWEYVRLLKETGASKFLLENVQMIAKWKDIISNTLGVEPIFLDSAVVSAQRRKRLYWTNIEGYQEPADRGIMLKDIIHETEYALIDRDKSLCVTANYGDLTDRDYFEKSRGQRILEVTEITQLELDVPGATKKGFASVGVGDGVDMTFLNSKTRRGRAMKEKSNCLNSSSNEMSIVEELKQYIVPFDKTLRILEKEVQRGKIGFFRTDSQANRVYFIHDKAVTLCGSDGGGAAKMGQYLFGCLTPDRVEKRQNGQRFNDGKKFYTLTAQDKHGVLIEGYIRKLTPIECERLQTVEDNYTQFGVINGKEEVISNAQRYKMLGNGWTVDAIVEFFKNL